MNSVYLKSQKYRKKVFPRSSSYTCPTCLSKNRDCVILGREQTAILRKLGIYNYIKFQEENTLSYWTRNLVCWECSARVKNIQRFRQRAIYAQTILSAQVDSRTTMSLSRLRISDDQNRHDYYHNEEEADYIEEISDVEESCKLTYTKPATKQISLNIKDMSIVKSSDKPLYIVVKKDGKMTIKQVVSVKNKVEQNSTGSPLVTQTVKRKDDSANTSAASNKKSTLKGKAALNAWKQLLTRKAFGSKNISQKNGSKTNTLAKSLMQHIDKTRLEASNNSTDLNPIESFEKRDVSVNPNLNEKTTLPKSHVSTDTLSANNALDVSKHQKAEEALNQRSYVIGGNRVIYDSDDGEIEMIEDEESLDVTQDLTVQNIDKTSTQIEKKSIENKKTSEKSSNPKEGELLDNTVSEQSSITDCKNISCLDSDDDSTVTLISTESYINKCDLEKDINNVHSNKKKKQNAIRIMKKYIGNMKLYNAVENKTVEEKSACKRMENEQNNDIIELSDNSDNGVESDNDEFDDSDFEHLHMSQKEINSNLKNSYNKITIVCDDDGEESDDTTDRCDNTYDSSNNYDLTNYVDQVTSAPSIQKKKNATKFEVNMPTNSTITDINESTVSIKYQIAKKVQDSTVTSNLDKDHNHISEDNLKDNSIENDVIMNENNDKRWVNKTSDSDILSTNKSNEIHLNTQGHILATCIESNANIKETENVEKDNKHIVNYASNFRSYGDKIAEKNTNVINSDNVETTTKNTPNNIHSSSEENNTVFSQKIITCDYENPRYSDQNLDLTSIDKNNSFNRKTSTKDAYKNNCIYNKTTELIEKASLHCANQNNTNVDPSIAEGSQDKDSLEKKTMGLFSATGENESNFETTGDSNCITENGIIVSKALLHSDDTLSPNNKDVNEEIKPISKNTCTTQLEEIHCTPGDTELNINKASKLQVYNETLNQQREDVAQEKITVSKNTDASEEEMICTPEVMDELNNAPEIQDNNETLNQQKTVVAEEKNTVSKNTEASVEEVICSSDDTNKLNNASKIQHSNETLYQQREDITEENMPIPNNTDAREEKEGNDNNTEIKMLPQTDYNICRLKYNVNEDGIIVSKPMNANEEINSNSNSIDSNSRTTITHIVDDDNIIYYETYENRTNTLESPLYVSQDICSESSKNYVKIPSTIYSETKSNNYIGIQVDPQAIDALNRKKINNLTTKSGVKRKDSYKLGKRIIKRYNSTKEVNAKIVPTVKHRQTLIVNRITSDAPPPVSQESRSSEKDIQNTHGLDNRRTTSNTDAYTNSRNCPLVLRKLHPKPNLDFRPELKLIPVTLVCDTRIVVPNKPVLDDTSETLSENFVSTESKTIPAIAPDIIHPKLDRISETANETDVKSELKPDSTTESELISSKYPRHSSDLFDRPIKRSRKKCSVSLPPPKQISELERVTLYEDILRIWQEHCYAELCFRRSKDTRKRLRHYKQYIKNRKNRGTKISEKTKEDADVNRDNSNDSRSCDDTITDDKISNKDYKNVFNVLANMQTINLNKFFPSQNATMLNLNDVINQEPIKTYKDLEAHISYQSEEFLPEGEDTENESKMINQEPDLDISDYEQEDLEPYYSAITANKGTFCEEEIDIKEEPRDWESCTTFSAKEDLDFDDEIYQNYQQDFTPENVNTCLNQSVTSDKRNEVNNEPSENKFLDIVTNIDTNANISADNAETGTHEEVNKTGLSSIFSDFDDDDAQEQPILNQINNILSSLEADDFEEQLNTGNLLQPVYFVNWNSETHDYVKEDITEETNITQEFIQDAIGKPERIITRHRRNRKRKYSSRRKSNSSLRPAKRKKKESTTISTDEEKCEIRQKVHEIKSNDKREEINQSELSIDEIYRIILGNDIMQQCKEGLQNTKQSGHLTPKLEPVDEDDKNNPMNIQSSLENNKPALTDFIDNNKVITLDELEDLEDLESDEDVDDNVTLNVLKPLLNESTSGSDGKVSCDEENVVETENPLLQGKSDKFIEITMKNLLVKIPLDVIEGLNIAHNIDDILNAEDFTSKFNEEISNAENTNQQKSNDENNFNAIEKTNSMNDTEEANKKEHTSPVKRKSVSETHNPNEESTNNRKTINKRKDPLKKNKDETTCNEQDLSESTNEEETNKSKDTLNIANQKTDTCDEKKDREVKIRSRKIVFKNHIRVLIDKNELELLRENERNTEKYKNALSKCESCVEVFAKAYIKRHHDQNYHVETPNCHTCLICDCKFTKKSLFFHHMEGHKRCFKCLYCENKYFRWKSMNEHIRQNNHGGKNADSTVIMKCHRCDAEFTKASSLNRHIRTKHEDEKFYSIYGKGIPRDRRKHRKTKNVEVSSDIDATSSKELVMSNVDVKSPNDDIPTMDTLSNNVMSSENMSKNNVESTDNLPKDVMTQ